MADYKLCRAMALHEYEHESASRMTKGRGAISKEEKVRNLEGFSRAPPCERKKTKKTKKKVTRKGRRRTQEIDQTTGNC